MPNITPEQLRERYKKLPPDVQEAYFSVETGEVLQKIGKGHNLTTEKIGIIADETGLLMLGVTHPNNFIKNLTSRLNIDRELAQKIAHQINDQIFKKIRESLRKIHEKTEPAKATTETKMSPTPAIKPVEIEKQEDQSIPTTIEPRPSFEEKDTKQPLNIEEETKEAPKPESQKEKTIPKPSPTKTEQPASTKEHSETKKGIFEERKKIFRSTPTKTIVKKELSKTPEKKPTPPKPTYPEGVDPYREPIE